MLRDAIEGGGALVIIGGLIYVGQWFYHKLVMRQSKFDAEEKQAPK